MCTQIQITLALKKYSIHTHILTYRLYYIKFYLHQHKLKEIKLICCLGVDIQCLIWSFHDHHHTQQGSPTYSINQRVRAATVSSYRQNLQQNKTNIPVHHSSLKFILPWLHSVHWILTFLSLTVLCPLEVCSSKHRFYGTKIEKEYMHKTIYLFVLVSPGGWAVSTAAAWKGGPAEEARGGPGRPQWTYEEAQSPHCTGLWLFHSL